MTKTSDRIQLRAARYNLIAAILRALAVLLGILETG